ncbi:MAG: hypothetical protein DDG59_05835 [Anaerolineae bacterium]|nr:MAG: hypothetical protein DDG59_05835 [Anaerolineae bacterium]
MNAAWAELAGVFVVLTVSLLNLVMQDWRKRIVALAAQAIGVFLLCFQSLSLNLALVKFIEGWMAAAILGTAMANVQSGLKTKADQPTDGASNFSMPLSAFVFRLATVLLISGLLYVGAPYLMSVFNGVRFLQSLAVLGLCGVGLLVLSFRVSALSLAIGLITVLNGFEILLAVIEPSLLLHGLLAGVILSIAFLGAFLLLYEGEVVPL